MTEKSRVKPDADMPRELTNMKNLIRKLIEEENKKNPLTDEMIAGQLNTFRENVTNIRRELDIPDSRKRRQNVLMEDIRRILSEHGNLSERNLTKLLKEEGYEIGKYAAGRLKSEIEAEREVPNERHSAKNKPDNEANHIFDGFIGYNGSMKNQISLAQAAVMYPPKGLHTLIYGPSGTGKSYLAELMCRYAVTTDNFPDNIPYFEFNCADYADNPQLLLAQLFGYSKGSFTGANEDKKGIVELCDGGILFLDEVHRLPAEGQEILFYLIDKGKFRRLGETDNWRESKVMIIAATTENPQSSLLLTFRRRIPMVIELPSMKERPLSEKMQFINNYFMMESRRLGREIHVKDDVMKCLAGAVYQGNVGQLKSDIQVCCAKAFLETKRKRSGEITVSLDSLSETTRADYHEKMQEKEISALVHGDTYFYPEENKVYQKKNFGKNIGKSGNIYERLDSRYEELKKEGIEETVINDILSREIEASLLRYIKEVEDSEFSFQEISNIVGDEILNITRKIYEAAKKKMPKLKSTIIFPMAIHINMTMERIRNRSKIIHTTSRAIKDQYEYEYKIAEEIIQMINEKYYIKIPEEEIGFFAMYFRNFQEQYLVKDGKIGLLVASHGKVACGMAEAANMIMGVGHAVGLEFGFQDSPSVMEEKVIRVIKQINGGKGCIILADMGSLLAIGEKIERKTGIRVGIVGRTDTLMVIECIRKVLWTEETIETIIRDLDFKNTLSLQNKTVNKIKEKALLCLCITGEGAARAIREHLQSRLKSSLGNIVILTRGYIEDLTVESIIKSVEAEYDIIAIVGTIDPMMEKYPFLSISEIYRPKGISYLRNIIKKNTVFDKNNLSQVIRLENIFVNPGFSYKDQVLDNAIKYMTDGGYVKPEFLLSVYKREGLMTTFLKGGIAIPHGDGEWVTKPVISVTKLDVPVIWDGINTVDIIFMLALNENSKTYFEQLYKIISDDRLITYMRKSKKKEEILHILCSNTLDFPVG